MEYLAGKPPSKLALLWLEGRGEAAETWMSGAHVPQNFFKTVEAAISEKR